MARISRRAKLNLTVFLSMAVVGAAVALFVIFIMPKMATVKFVDAANVNTEIADSISLEKGTTLPLELPRPTKYGHYFDDWYYSKEVNENVKVNPGVDIIDDDTTLYGNFIASKFTVKYNLNGGFGNNIPDKTETYNVIFKLPTEIAAGIYKPDLVLKGWCKSPEGKDVLFKPGEEVKMFGEDTTLYAIWGPPQTTVYYVGGIGTEYIYQKTFDSNAVIPDEDDNRRDAYRYGYNFEGWYTDETYTTRIDFDTFILRGNEVRIYAKFTPKRYTVTFMLDGAVYETQDVYFDGKIAIPNIEPTKIGSVFVGWFVDETGFSTYNFDTVIKDDPPKTTTLYGKWGEIPQVEDETPASAFNYTKNTDNNTVSITGIKDTTLNLIVFPRQIDGWNVVSISGIKNMEQLTEIRLPYTIRTISEDTFSGCPKLTQYTMISQSSYFVAENGVLYSADYKTLYRYPASKPETSYETHSATETIMPYAFGSSRILQNLTLNAITINQSAFFNCTSIVNLTLSNKVLTVAENAFVQCGSFVTVVSNTSNVVVENGAIYNATKNRLIKYFNKDANANYVAPASLTSADSYAFANCTNLISATFQENFKVIGGYAFYGCTSLTTLEFKAQTFNSAGEGILTGCTAIETIRCNMVSTNPLYGKLQMSPETSDEMFEQI